jgi:hypothetical protein
MEELNKGITFTRGVPLDRWDSDAYMRLYENQYQEALKRLEKFKQDASEKEQKFISLGVSTFEIENWKYGQTNEHIQLLERVIDSKKQIDWLKRGLRQLIKDKISLLESMI